MDTGEIEVQLESVKSINQSEVKLPFYVKSFNEAQESLRHSGFLLFFHQKFQQTARNKFFHNFLNIFKVLKNLLNIVNLSGWNTYPLLVNSSLNDPF